MADACAVSGYTRDQMRALLRDLPAFTADQGMGKSRVFTRVELLTIAIIAMMERRYGIKRKAIGAIIDELVVTLKSPRVVDAQACLVIITGDRTVIYSRLNDAISDGVVIPLASIFEQVDIYLGAKSTQKQIELGLEPSVIRKP